MNKKVMEAGFQYQFTLNFYRSTFISFQLLKILAIILVASSLLEEAASARNFAKFWNFTLVFPSASVTSVNSITIVLSTRAECVVYCGNNAGCCCTQWLYATNTCTILMADRAGLSPTPLAVSSIDSVYLKLKLLSIK
jgi:hypothetical protein